MPDGGITAAIANVLLSATGAYSVGATAAAYTFAAAATYASGAYLLNKASQALMPDAPKNKGAGYELNYAGTDVRRKIVYGEVRIGGMQTIPPVTSGTEGRYLHFVLALAGHECESITDLWFDRDQIATADIGAIAGTDADGLVGGSNKYKDIAWIRRYTGTASQNVDYILNQAFPTEFGSDFRGRGIAYIALRLKHKEKVYSGVPGVVATVRGYKCYDPRTATTVWTQNPAIIARHYLVTEVGYSTDEIDDTSVIAAANVCDQTVAIPTAATQARYQCNVMLEAASEPSEWEENLRTIVDTMRGRAVQRDGKWYLYAGAWDVPAVAIDTADWIGPTTVRASAPPDERWNAVRVWYVDEARDYQRVECYPRRNLGYETADGGDRIWLELELPGVTNEYEAQRHGEFALRASRNQLTVTGTLRPEYFKLATWDTVTITDSDYGWSSKTFRVAAMDLTPMGEVSVTLVEEGSATWTDLLEAEYNAIATVYGIDPGLSLPEQRTGLVITGLVESIGFSWDQPADPLIGERTRLMEGYNNTLLSTTEIWRGDSTGVVLRRQPTDLSTKWYWIQGVVGSYGGLYTPSSFGTPMGANPTAYSTVNAYMEPPIVALPADVAGTVADYSAARGQVNVVRNGTIVNEHVTFDVGSAAGVTGTINSADNLPWYGASRGAYRVTACTSDIGILWTTATYSGMPYLLPFTVVKQRSGVGMFAFQQNGTGSLTISGDSVVCTGVSGGWVLGADTLESYAGGAFISARAHAYPQNAMFGLNNDGHASAGYADINYAWLTSISGYAYIYENGVEIGAYDSYSTDTLLSIQYDGRNVTYFKDGVLKRTVATTPGIRMYGDIAFDTTGAGFDGIRFGPVGAAGADGADGTDGTDGEIGPSGANIVANGMMDLVDADGNTLLMWNAPSNATAGISGTRCMELPSWTAVAVEHEDYIPINPLTEKLGLSVQVSQTSVGARALYLGLACYDRYLRPITSAGEAWQGFLTVFTDTSSTGVRVYKPSAKDSLAAAYAADPLNSLIIPGEGPYTDASSLISGNLSMYERPINTISTANTSYDVFTLATVAPRTLWAGEVLPFGYNGGAIAKYVYIGTPSAGAFDQFKCGIEGTIHPAARCVAPETFSLRHGTRYVRPFLYVTAAAGEVLVDDFVIWRETRQPETYAGDGRMTSSGRWWWWGTLTNSWVSTMPVTFHPTSGPAGNGALVFNAISVAGAWNMGVRQSSYQP